MSDDDAQKTWDDYFLRMKSLRLQEAAELWVAMEREGVDEETVLAIDFVHFGPSKSDIEALSEQLSENYQMEVVPSGQQGYWLAKGTTRPYGVTMGRKEFLGWIEFMADVAQSYACVFSTWELEAQSIEKTFRSEDIDGDG